MSSLFNYELDEKNIRTTLQNARHSAFSEASWNEFEENFANKLAKPSPASFIKLPDIHLNINRNVILPVAFILALVGLSAIILSFIDFKPDAEQQVERKLEPNANNFISKTPVNTPVVEAKTTEPAKPKTAEVIVKKDSIANTPGPETGVVANSVSTNTHTVNLNPASTTIQSVAKTNEPVIQAVVNPTVQNVYYKQRRKKIEKVPETQMETIKAPALIKEETETTEPELEIKID
jgi:hypothetical protein